MHCAACKNEMIAGVCVNPDCYMSPAFDASVDGGWADQIEEAEEIEDELDDVIDDSDEDFEEYPRHD